MKRQESPWLQPGEYFKTVSGTAQTEYVTILINPEYFLMYQNLILFDGVCNFCNGAVQMVIEIDRQKIFKFAAIQSELGQQLYRQHGLDPIDIQTLMLVDGDRVFTKSDAVLNVLGKLDGGWQFLAAFKNMPQPLRDWAYSEFARQRFLLFGRRETCMVPTPELQERFLS